MRLQVELERVVGKGSLEGGALQLFTASMLLEEVWVCVSGCLCVWVSGSVCLCVWVSVCLCLCVSRSLAPSLLRARSLSPYILTLLACLRSPCFTRSKVLAYWYQSTNTDAIGAPLGELQGCRYAAARGLKDSACVRRQQAR